MKKHIYLVGLAAIAAIAVTPFNGSPLLAAAIDAGKNLAETVLNKPKVTLQLTADRQQIRKDAQGKDQVSWEPLGRDKAVVKPGDVLRYKLIGNNQGTQPAKNLTIVQPIPKGTLYVLNSAVADSQTAKITFSIDNGMNFVVKPMVKVTLTNGQVEERPAPAATYTHVRLNFGSELAPKTAMQATYQVQVRQ